MAELQTTITMVAGEETFSVTDTKTYKEMFKIEQELTHGAVNLRLVGFNPGSKDSQNMEDCRGMLIQNISTTPAELKYSMGVWTDGDPDTPVIDTRHINQILLPNELIYFSNVRFLDIDGASGSNADELDNVVPATAGKLDSTANIDEGEAFASDDTTLTVTDGDYFKVNDYIQIDDEILKVTAVGDEDLTVQRGKLGTSGVQHDDSTDIYFYFYNTEYPNDSVVKTDKNGKFSCSNFFGYARTSNAIAAGVVSGSVAVKFYNAGYQDLGMDAQTNSTDTGLTASTQYYFKINKDVGGVTEYDITTDSSNVNWGGTNGVIAKIQDELDDNNAEVTVTLVGGDIRFTSDSHLSTSAIALTDGTTGTSLFGSGQIPADADMQYAVDAELPDDTIYETENNIGRPNTSVFLIDNGDGTLARSDGGTGTINYETGALTMTGCPADAEFVVSAFYESAFSGSQNHGVSDGDTNIMTAINAKSVSAKSYSKIKLIAWG